VFPGVTGKFAGEKEVLLGLSASELVEGSAGLKVVVALDVVVVLEARPSSGELLLAGVLINVAPEVVGRGEVVDGLALFEVEGVQRLVYIILVYIARQLHYSSS
jgi:hypothetical protein